MMRNISLPVIAVLSFCLFLGNAWCQSNTQSVVDRSSKEIETLANSNPSGETKDDRKKAWDQIKNKINKKAGLLDTNLFEAWKVQPDVNKSLNFKNPFEKPKERWEERYKMTKEYLAKLNELREKLSKASKQATKQAINAIGDEVLEWGAKIVPGVPGEEIVGALTYDAKDLGNKIKRVKTLDEALKLLEEERGRATETAQEASDIRKDLNALSDEFNKIVKANKDPNDRTYSERYRNENKGAKKDKDKEKKGAKEKDKKEKAEQEPPQGQKGKTGENKKQDTPTKKTWEQMTPEERRDAIKRNDPVAWGKVKEGLTGNSKSGKEVIDAIDSKKQKPSGYDPNFDPNIKTEGNVSVDTAQADNLGNEFQEKQRGRKNKEVKPQTPQDVTLQPESYTKPTRTTGDKSKTDDSKEQPPGYPPYGPPKDERGQKGTDWTKWAGDKRPVYDKPENKPKKEKTPSPGQENYDNKTKTPEKPPVIKRGPAGSSSGTFDKELFNGLQIVYSISGPQLGQPKDSEGFTHTRSFEGQLAGNTFTVSGTGIYDKPANYDTEYGSFYGTLDVTVSAGKETKNYVYTQPKGAGPMRQAFSVSIPIPDDATSGSFSIRVTYVNPRFGNRGVVVSGSLK